MIKTLSRVAATRLLLGALCAIPFAASAALEFPPTAGGGVYDTETDLYWKNFAADDAAAGAAQGYRAATVEEVSALLDHRVAGLAGHTGSDLYPHVPGDGHYYFIWSAYRSVPAVFRTDIVTALANFPFDPNLGDSFSRTLLTTAQDAGTGSLVGVSFETHFNDSPADANVGLYENVAIQFGTTVPSGAAANRLLVKAVPEPGTYALVGLGLAAAAFAARGRRQAA